MIRDENQDEVLAKDYHGRILTVLCDGMGGEKSGSLASRMAVDEFFDHFTAGYQDGMDVEQVRVLLLSSVSAANSVIYSSARMDYQNYGMGTTCVAAFAEPGWVSIVNVGDSRAYLIENEKIRQITSDHTVVNQLYQDGKLALEDINDHPMRNMLTKAVGVERVVKPDYYHVACQEDFRLLLCSDGLSSFCSEQELLDTILGNTFTRMPQALVNIALEKGGRDNISLAIITN
ncbi:MAG: protein phosphatase 2C domain-containing protein [Oscillospiraceae bacterium]|nr:protein phosphatase 2C domain-containing protein [Oscillospiraceae bacterium]